MRYDGSSDGFGSFLISLATTSFEVRVVDRWGPENFQIVRGLSRVGFCTSINVRIVRCSSDPLCISDQNQHFYLLRAGRDMVEKRAA